MTDHPLNQTAEITEEMDQVAAVAFHSALHGSSVINAPSNYVIAARAALRAALAVAPTDARPWEPLNGGRVRVGDEVRREVNGLTTTAVVGSVDKDGDPWTAEGGLIGVLDLGTWYVRRAVQELPTKCGTVIVANDGHKFIKAEVDGIAHRAREAVLGANGWWYGAWRKAEGDGLLSAMFPEHISAPTWKVDDQ